MDYVTKSKYPTMKTAMKIASLGLVLITLAQAHSTEMGRLFFTPTQRAQLNENKQQHGALNDGLIVNGIVQQQGGNRTVWINGIPRNIGKNDEANPASLSLTPPNQTVPRNIKVGQKIHLYSTHTSPP